MRNRTIALLLTGLLAIVVFAFGGPGLLALTGSTTPAARSSAAPVQGAPVPGPGEVPAPAVAPANPSGNFERILPRQDSGYYREYTVPTAGESDRGARRIVTGSEGEKYYTQDHYDSFKFIAEGS